MSDASLRLSVCLLVHLSLYVFYPSAYLDLSSHATIHPSRQPSIHPIHPSNHLSTDLPIYPPMGHQSIDVPIYLPIDLSVCRSIYVSSLSVCFICLSLSKLCESKLA